MSSCADLNYGAYHVIFSNIVGSQSKGMVVDRERGIQARHTTGTRAQSLKLVLRRCGISQSTRSTQLLFTSMPHTRV